MIDKSFGEKGHLMLSIFENRGCDGRIKSEFSLHEIQQPENLQQKTDGNGWMLHQFAIVFRGWECKVCEEVSEIRQKILHLLLWQRKF